MKRIYIFWLLLVPCYALAGNWHYFPSTDNYRRIQCAGDIVYLLRGNRLIQANGRSWTSEREYDRQHGLSDINILDISYSDKAQKLAIIYSNGLIDFLHTDNTITCLPDLKETPLVGQSKHINHVLTCNGTLCISADFGFMTIDPENEMIRDCVTTEQAVDYAWADDTAYYYTTKSGSTYSCPFNSNLFNPHSWSTSTAQPPLPELPSGAIDVSHSVTGDTIYTLYPDRGLISSSQEQAFNVKQYQLGNTNNRLLISNGTIATCHVSDLTFFDYDTNVKTQGYLSEYYMDEDQWVNMDHHAVIDHLSNRQTFGGLMDMVPDPATPHQYYYSTLENGIYVTKDGSLVRRWDKFDGTNHVEAFAGSSTRVGGLTFSPLNDFWFINEGMDDILRVRTHNGVWHKFKVEGAEGQVSMPHLIHSTHGNASTLWGCRTAGYQKCLVFAYDYAGTLGKTDDDRSVTFQKLIDENGKTIHPYYFNNITEGPNGEIWILTTQGIYVIDNPDQVFEHPGKVRTAFDNLNANAIVFDTEGHIWIGTPRQGILLYDSTGSILLQQFSTDNTPLTSNEILALAFDAEAHQLWVSCVGGILSYQYDSSDYLAPSISDVYCYPSAILAGESAPITITGLTDHMTACILNQDDEEVMTCNVIGRTVTIDSSLLPSGEYKVAEKDQQGQSHIVSSFIIER